MAQLAVIHSAFSDREAPRTVALVEVGEREGIDALEYAYCRTQNIEGSWSKGSTFEFMGKTYTNSDYSPDVTVMAELPKRDGEEYGLRSTSTGDQILMGTHKYQVDDFGFQLLG